MTAAAVTGWLADLRIRAPDVRISTGALDRICYGRDASPDAFLQWRDGTPGAGPDAVAWPGCTADVVACVQLAAEHNVALTAYGAGSGVVRGIQPAAGAAVVDIKRLDAVHINAARREVRAGAGVIGERLEHALNAAGLTAGHFPSSIYCSTVGGWAAARSAGQLSSRYGKIEDIILALEAVDGTGRVLRASRQDGEPLLRAIIGSEGALALITEVTLRVHPLASHHAVLGLAAPDVPHGLTFMRRVLQAGLRPAVFRMYDPPDTVLAGGIPKGGDAPHVAPGPISAAGHEYPHMMGTRPAPEKHLWTMLRSRSMAAARASGMTRKALSAAMSHTRWLAMPYQHLPQRCLMIMGLEGDHAGLTDDLAVVLALAAECGVDALGTAPGERWMRRRHAVTWKMPPHLAHGGWADTLEVSASWSVLPALYQEARTAMLEHAVTLAHFSHAYPEGGSIYFTMGGAGEDLQTSRRAHDQAVAAALSVFARHGASLSHHHGAGRMKAPFMSAAMGPGVHQAMAAMKKTLDPRRILNPGVLETEA